MIHDSVDKAEQSPSRLGLGSYGWRHNHWDGVFFPDDLPEDWQLGYYANEFSAVLVPQNYWQIDSGFEVDSWRDDVSEEFRFYIEWPFDSAEAELAQLCIQQCRDLGELLGGIMVHQDFVLTTDLPVYYRSQQGLLEQRVWTPGHNASSGVALIDIAGQDLRTQRRWLEQFSDSTDHLRCVLLSDASIEIEALRNMKTLLELLGL